MANPIDFKQYELDRDIPDTQWEDYLKKYKDKFIIKQSEDKIWYIDCYYGQIKPYSILKGYLGFYGIFPNSYKKAYFKRKIKEFDVEVVQEATEEISLKFKEPYLFSLLEILKVKRKPNLSNEERERRKQRMLKYHKTKRKV